MNKKIILCFLFLSSICHAEEIKSEGVLIDYNLKEQAYV